MNLQVSEERGAKSLSICTGQNYIKNNASGAIAMLFTIKLPLKLFCFFS